MKKFTVISLLLVLVAGFAFAALTPYVKSNAGITFNGIVIPDETDSEAVLYDGNGKKNKFLSSADFTGDFTYGAKTDKVDIKGNIALDYVDLPNEAGTASDFYYAELGTVTDLKDCLTITPSITFGYKDSNLKVDASATYEQKRAGSEIFGMDIGKGNGSVAKPGFVSDKYTFKVSADYAANLKNSTNIAKVSGGENLVISGATATSTTSAAIAYYVPKAGVTPAATFAPTFANYTFAGFVDGNVKIVSNDGNVDRTKTTKYVGGEMDYVRYDENDNSLAFKGYGKVNTVATSGEDVATVTVGASVTADYSEVKGFNGLDVFTVSATAGIKNVSEKAASRTTTGNAEVTIDVPRLIPVELIANASYNLPATFDLAYDYSKVDAGAVVQTLSCDITVHPAYVEFQKEFKLFDKYVNVLDTTFKYGNAAEFTPEISKFVTPDHWYNIAASATLGLAATKTFTANTTSFGLSYAKIEGEVGLVTLSYKAAY